MDTYRKALCLSVVFTAVFDFAGDSRRRPIAYGGDPGCGQRHIRRRAAECHCDDYERGHRLDERS